MLYDLDNILDRERFKRRSTQMLERGSGVVELTDKTKRSTRQNAYLHAILGWFAIETGNTLEFVKNVYFKQLVNRDLFVTVKDDRWAGRCEVIRSSSDLSKEQMTEAITRFRNWSSQEAGIYLPSADEDSFLAAIEVEMSRQRAWL